MLFHLCTCTFHLWGVLREIWPMSKNVVDLFTSSDIIGITHVISCINICRVPKELFKQEADRQSVQTSPDGTRQVLMQWNNMWSLFFHFYLITTNSHWNAAKTLNIHFLTRDFSKQNGVSCKLLNVITSSQHYSRMQHFHKQKHWGNDQYDLQLFLKRHANNSGLILSTGISKF